MPDKPRSESPKTNPIAERFYGVISALVTLEDDDANGKVPYKALALNYARPAQADKNLEVTLSRFLRRKFRANAASAIDLGEALYASDVPWCSGWWMLYAAGRYVEYVFVTAHAIEALKREQPAIDLQALWKMIVGAHELCLSTELDDEPAVARLHRQHSGPITRANRIYCEARPASESSQQSSVDFLRRETAKAAYRAIDSMRPYLSEAYSKFFTSFGSNHQQNLRTLEDRHALGAVTMAAASGIPLHHKEFLVRHHLKAQIENLTSGRNKLTLKEYELSSIMTPASPDRVPGIEELLGLPPEFKVDADDDRMIEALSRIAAPWFYEDEDHDNATN